MHRQSRPSFKALCFQAPGFVPHTRYLRLRERPEGQGETERKAESLLKRPTLKISYNAPVTLTFALLCLLALGLGQLTNGWTTSHLFQVYRCSLADPLAFARFFGHVLGHANFNHFIGNIVLILVLGPGLEDRYGSYPVLWAVLLTALVSGLIQFICFPGTALLGASGIVFMMILLSSFAGMKQGTIPLTLIFVAVFYLGGQLWDALFVQDNISQLTHIIGGLCGTVLGFSLGRK